MYRPLQRHLMQTISKELYCLVRALTIIENELLFRTYYTEPENEYSRLDRDDRDGGENRVPSRL